MEDDSLLVQSTAITTNEQQNVQSDSHHSEEDQVIHIELSLMGIFP